MTFHLHQMLEKIQVAHEHLGTCLLVFFRNSNLEFISFPREKDGDAFLNSNDLDEHHLDGYAGTISLTPTLSSKQQQRPRTVRQLQIQHTGSTAHAGEQPPSHSLTGKDIHRQELRQVIALLRHPRESWS